MKRRDRENIGVALAQTNWRVHGPGGAAELLGMRATTLASRIKRMQLKKRRNRRALSEACLTTLTLFLLVVGKLFFGRPAPGAAPSRKT